MCCFCICEASNQKDIVGILIYSGTVCSYSYLNSKEPISQAVADIKVLINVSEDVPYLGGILESS